MSADMANRAPRAHTEDWVQSSSASSHRHDSSDNSSNTSSEHSPDVVDTSASSATEQGAPAQPTNKPTARRPVQRAGGNVSAPRAQSTAPGQSSNQAIADALNSFTSTQEQQSQLLTEVFLRTQNLPNTSEPVTGAGNLGMAKEERSAAASQAAKSVPKLEGAENYKEWAWRTSQFFKLENIWDVCSGIEAKPASGTALNAYNRKDSTALTLIEISLSLDSDPYSIYNAHAKDGSAAVWKAFAKRYGVTSYLEWFEKQKEWETLNARSLGNVANIAAKIRILDDRMSSLIPSTKKSNAEKNCKLITLCDQLGFENFTGSQMMEQAEKLFAEEGKTCFDFDELVKNYISYERYLKGRSEAEDQVMMVRPSNPRSYSYPSTPSVTSQAPSLPPPAPASPPITNMSPSQIGEAFHAFLTATKPKAQNKPKTKQYDHPVCSVEGCGRRHPGGMDSCWVLHPEQRPPQWQPRKRPHEDDSGGPAKRRPGVPRSIRDDDY